MTKLNKKIVGIVMLAIFIFAGGAVFAQTDGFEDPGMLPDHPLYFMKRGVESVGTFFRFSDEAKADRYLGLAEKRISEANALTEKGNSELVERTLERYQEQMNKGIERAERAKERGRDMDEVLERVSEATVKHQEVLTGVYEKVPEEDREGIQRAMEASEEGGRRALNSVSEEKREEARERVNQKRREVEERLENLPQGNRPVPETPQGEGDGMVDEEFLETPGEEDVNGQPEDIENLQQEEHEEVPELMNEEGGEEVDEGVDEGRDNAPETPGR